MANRLFFDIETGGFSAKKSQIFSLAFAQDEQKPIPLGAKLKQGTTLSRWSEKKVWEPLKSSGVRLQQERELLSSFLKVLDTAPAGTQLVGWNIGYVPAPQDQTRAGGFDVGFIMSRAKHYGMEEQFRAGFKRHQIMDLGSIWALRIAEAAAGEQGQKLVEEGVMHPTLHKEAVGYMKQAARLKYEWGLSKEADIAEALSRENVRFAGWKQELVYEVLTGKPLAEAHEAAADVGALQQIIRSERHVDETFLRKWSPLALRNKLVSRAKYVPELAEEAVPARFTEIMAEAKQWNVARDVENTLRTMAEESGTSFESIRAGKGIPRLQRTVRVAPLAERLTKINLAGMGEFVDELLPAVKAHGGKIAIGAGFAAAMLLEPGSWFSGSDDEYNTLEAFQHGGEADQLRQMLADFGSGWIRTAISKGMSHAKVASQAAKLGVGKSGLSTQEFASVLERELDDGLEGAMKWYREQTGISVEGQRWIYSKKLGAGAFGEAWTAQRAGGRAQAGVVKTLKDPDADPLGKLAKAMRENPDADPEGIIMTPALANYVQEAMQSDEVMKARSGMDFAASYMKQIAGTMNEHKINSLQYEAMMTKMARKEAGPRTFVPEVFAVNEKAMVQELAGQGISDLPAERMKGLAKWMEIEPGYNISKRSGVVHLDPHTGNIVRRGANYSMIDYGLAVPATEATQLGREQILAPAYKKYISKKAAMANPALPSRPAALQGGGTVTPPPAGPPPPVPGGIKTGIARPHARNQAEKVDQILTPTVVGRKGPAADEITKKLTDFGSPVNLAKAAMRSGEMVNQLPKVAAQAERSILEPAKQAAKRKTRMIAKHKEAMVRNSVNTRRPGKRHRQKTGRVVL